MILSYIDPMSGAVVLQLIVAGVIAVVTFFWRAIARLVGKVFRMTGGNDDASDR